LYQWECNIRLATILGFVGAGGIGQQILVFMNLFDCSKVAILVGVTLLVPASFEPSRRPSIPSSFRPETPALSAKAGRHGESVTVAPRAEPSFLSFDHCPTTYDKWLYDKQLLKKESMALRITLSTSSGVLG
jgi:hypothetical protein